LDSTSAASGSTFRAMLALALPVLAEESLNLLVAYTDWFLAGRFLPGEAPKAAMGLVAYILWVLPSLFSIVSIGALAIVARFVGAGERRQAAHFARQALIVGCVVAAIGMTLAALFGGAFVDAMQLRGDAALLARRYVHVLVPAIPFVMVEQVGTACLRGAGDTVSGLAARVVVTLVNAVLSAVLVTGVGPFPQLGWDGLAIGTTAGHFVGGLMILGCLLLGRGGLPIADFQHAPIALPCMFDRIAIRRILRIGVPGGIDVWAVVGCHLMYAAIINSLGTLAQAAHGLGLQIEAMSYLPGSAFGVAAATLAGQSLGARDQRRAARGVLLCAGSAAAIMSAAGVLMFVAGEPIAIFFTGQRSELTALVGRLLKVVAISCPALGVLTVVLGALRGAGDTRSTLVITFIGLVGVRLPAACFLAWPEVPIPFAEISIPGLGLGVIGAWLAMVADVILRSLLAAGRFALGGWKSVRV
jgi:putative MATE family efflux protein